MVSSATDDQAEANRRGQNGRAKEGRRNFLKASLAAAVVFVIAGVAAVTKSLWTPSVPTGTGTSAPAFPRAKVANLADLKPNSPVIFYYPLENTPNTLVKTGLKAEGGVGPDGDVVAFSLICQHLGCIYGYQGPGSSPSCDSGYQAPGPVGYCCCHGSVYDFLKSAEVLQGPAPRPVPQVKLEYDSTSGDIFAVGMGPPTIFGHDTGSDNVLDDLQGGTPVS